MDRPNVIRILTKRHRLLWDQELPERYGDYSPMKSLVRIAGDLPPDEEKETLLHECIHAVEQQMNIDLTEEAVRQLSIGVFALLRDNPVLVAYLMDGAGGGDEGDE